MFLKTRLRYWVSPLTDYQNLFSDSFKKSRLFPSVREYLPLDAEGLHPRSAPFYGTGLKIFKSCTYKHKPLYLVSVETLPQERGICSLVKFAFLWNEGSPSWNGFGNYPGNALLEVETDVLAYTSNLLKTVSDSLHFYAMIGESFKNPKIIESEGGKCVEGVAARLTPLPSQSSMPGIVRHYESMVWEAIGSNVFKGGDIRWQ